MGSSRPAVSAALAGFLLGLSVTILSSSEILPSVRSTTEAPAIAVLEPAVALHAASPRMALIHAEAFLATQRPWAAWQALEPLLDGDEAPALALLAARAAAGWGGWDEVVALLHGRAWLDHAEGGEGWRLLATALERRQRWADAAVAHGRFLGVSPAELEPATRARLAHALGRAGRGSDAADAFQAAAVALPAIGDWLRVLELETRLEAGRPDPARLLGAAASGSTAARMRRARAEAGSWLAIGDTTAAEARLRSDIRVLSQQGATGESAELALELARVQLAAGRLEDGRDLLRAAAWEGTVPVALRVRAAERLGELSGARSAAEELARAAAYEAGRRPAAAARSLRNALAAGAADSPIVQLRLGRLLWEAGLHSAAREVLVAAAAQLEPAELAADAALLAARARLDGGDRAGGIAELQRVAGRPAPAAGTALFLLADAAATVEAAIPLYRRAAAFEAAPESREALRRLADRQLRTGALAAAVGSWEEYVRRFPHGDESARLAFDLGLRHARAGRAEAAAAAFRMAVRAAPVSYVGIRAGERIGVDAVAGVLAEHRPWPALAQDAADANAVLTRLRLLGEIGLEAEFAAELDAAVRRLEHRPAALATLAEGLAADGRLGESMRLGRRLLALRGGRWDERLLRIVFPFPYRDLILAEAERYDVDPHLFVALVHQESAFRPAVRSRVGATGLSQIMPATGRWLAPRVGITADVYTDRVLDVPEVNVRMGALYLGDLLRRYGGAADLALAGYNAGPGRADRWRRELAYDRDIDAFRDAIPFDETRHYVRVVLRNAAVYRALYQRPGAPAAAGPTSVAE